MTTLLLPPRITEDGVALSRAAARAGWDVERLPSWHIPPLLREEDVVLFAEPLFVLHAAPQLDLAMIETPYGWLPNLPRKYVMRDVRLMTLREARSLKEEWFVKPAMEKFFAAGVISDGAALPGRDAASDAVPVLVSEVVRWAVEFRSFVKDRRNLTMSPYLVNGQLARTADDRWEVDESLDRDASAFLDGLLRDESVLLPPAVVIDFGRLADGSWAIVEANPAWGSGIYGCDTDAVLDVVRRSCVKTHGLTAEDAMWVIDHAAEDFT
jgi:hypothetical protein